MFLMYMLLGWKNAKPVANVPGLHACTMPILQVYICHCERLACFKNITRLKFMSAL